MSRPGPAVFKTVCAAGASDRPAVDARWTFDLGLRRVFRGDEPVRATLTPREWQVLEALATRAGAVWPEADLESFLRSGGVALTRNAIRIHLCNIRRKVGSGAIQTLPGKGYRIPPQARLIGG